MYLRENSIVEIKFIKVERQINPCVNSYVL